MAAETTTPPAAAVPAVAQPPKAPLVVGSRVAAIVPTDIEQIFRLAGAIAAAGWAPKSYLVDPRNDQSGYDKNKILVGIMQGMEVGLTPLAALQSIAVINGMPSLWGDGLLAVVRASGLMADIKEEVFFDGAAAAEAATCTVWRVSQTTPIQRTFTRAQAQKAGLWSKQGPWTQYPQRMLAMRARAWALRDGFADVLRGMRSAEEVEDTPRDITPTTPEPRRTDFGAQGGGYDPEVSKEPAERATITDAEVHDEVRTDDDAPVLYELFDHSGEQIGEYPIGEWVGAFDAQMPKPAMKRERNLHFANNEDTAHTLLISGPITMQKQLVERWPALAQEAATLAQSGDLLAGAK